MVCVARNPAQNFGRTQVPADDHVRLIAFSSNDADGCNSWRRLGYRFLEAQLLGHSINLDIHFRLFVDLKPCWIHLTSP